MLKNYSKVDENNKFGVRYYFNDKGINHRLDGSAIEYSDGSKRWYINGNKHRNIDPADEYSDGEKCWSFKGKQHRIGGLSNSAFRIWYIHGKDYTKRKYFNIVWGI